MEDTEKSKNKRTAIKISKYKKLRYLKKESFIMENIGKVIDLLSKKVYNYNESH